MALDVLKGLTPNRKLGSRPNSTGFGTYPIANGYGSDIGEGDPVKLSAGVIQLADNDSVCLGIFIGCHYANADGQVIFNKTFPTGTSSKGGVQLEGGYTQPLAKVVDDPDSTFIIRTVDAVSVSQGLLGSSFKVSAIGSVVNGRSQAVLDLTSAGTSTGDGHMITVIGLWTGRDNEWGDAPTAVEVKLSNPGIVGEL